MSQIFSALSFEETPKGLDYIIDQALASDDWIEKPPTTDEQNWFQGLVAHTPMLSSSQIKKLGPKVEPIKKRFKADFHGLHGGKIHDCFNGTSAKEDRIAARSIKTHRESFIVKIEKYRNVNHTPENPVWKIPGFCYLECINLALDRGHFWPTNPTVYTFADFGRKFRKSINFSLIETKLGKHFTVKTFPGGDSVLAWRRLEHLATTDKSFMCVGGNDDSSAIKPIDGTNYKQWAPKMRAYLMSKELWGYISGTIPCPKAASIPKEPTADPTTGMITTAQKEAYDKQLIAFNAANKKFIQWNIDDDKALGSMQLQMINKLGYLIKDNKVETWNNIKKQFDVSGPAAIFVDFRYVINFKFDEKKDPSVQVAELNTKLDVLSSHGFVG